MSTLSSWMMEITGSVSALASDSGLGIDQPPDAVLSRSVALAGFPGVLPLWSGRRHTVGLLTDSRDAPQKWPAVIIKDGQGLTLASDARTVLPQFLVMRVLSNAPDSARQVAERWSEVRANALALHRTLGGAEETLEAVVNVASDPAARESFKYRKDQGAVFEAAHSALCRKIDNSESFLRYADWLDACIAGRWRLPEEHANYGSWSRRVLCWAQRLAFSESAMPKLAAHTLHPIIEGHAGVDSGVPIEPTWSAKPGGASGESALVEAAMVIDHEPPPPDPVTAGLVKALVTEGTDYNGYAHAEAVVALDERGEPERAWEVMQSAAWWATRSTGELPVAMLKGVHFLADRHDWVDVLWAVERAMNTA